jgi:hypothetical protein
MERREPHAFAAAIRFSARECCTVASVSRDIATAIALFVMMKINDGPRRAEHDKIFLCNIERGRSVVGFFVIRQVDDFRQAPKFPNRKGHTRTICGIKNVVRVHFVRILAIAENGVARRMTASHNAQREKRLSAVDWNAGHPKLRWAMKPRSSAKESEITSLHKRCGDLCVNIFCRIPGMQVVENMGEEDYIVVVHPPRQFYWPCADRDWAIERLE